MNLIHPFAKDAAQATGLPGDALTPFQIAADGIGLLADDGPDGRFGMLMSAAAGVATALAVAIILTVYFRSGHRSARDILRHGVAVAVALGLFAFVAYDMRHAAFAYLGINLSKSTVEFEIRLPQAAASAATDTQVELHTDKNQTLAQLQRALASDGEGRSILRGSVALDFRTTDRVVVLNLPGQAQRRFKLRLAASPSRSDQFGPWHLTDRVASPDLSKANPGEATRSEPNDAFAIRYRVL
jgi:hypothetical protein